MDARGTGSSCKAPQSTHTCHQTQLGGIIPRKHKVGKMLLVEAHVPAHCDVGPDLRLLGLVDHRKSQQHSLSHVTFNMQAKQRATTAALHGQMLPQACTLSFSPPAAAQLDQFTWAQLLPPCSKQAARDTVSSGCTAASDFSACILLPTRQLRLGTGQQHLRWDAAGVDSGPTNPEER